MLAIANPWPAFFCPGSARFFSLPGGVGDGGGRRGRRAARRSARVAVIREGRGGGEEGLAAERRPQSARTKNNAIYLLNKPKGETDDAPST